MGKYFFQTLSIALSCLYLGGCATITEAVSGLFRQEDDAEASMAAQYFDGPRVKPGVALVIIVSTAAQQPVRMEVQVDQCGQVTLPHLLQTPVDCSGMTLEELRAKLVKEYSVYYKQPMVTVTFAPFDGRSGSVSPWGTVNVLGEVANPGPVNMSSTMDMTVTKALQAAGGLKPFADKTHIQVTRCDRDGKQTKYIIDLKEIGQDGRIDKDMSLRAGDVIYARETWY